MIRKTSNKKQSLLDEVNSQEFKVGESVVVRTSDLNILKSDKSETEEVTIIEVLDTLLWVKCQNYKENYSISKEKIIERSFRFIGANPFIKFSQIRNLNYNLESIIFEFQLDNEKQCSKEDKYDIKGVLIKEVNWNPFVIKNGNKYYYQRDYIWTLEQKQNLIESIYLYVDCGKVLVRVRSWKQLEQMQSKGELELSFKDIVDGKQRLKAISDFINDKFPDLNGNYYGDLSTEAQIEFSNSKSLSCAELGEYTTDKEVLQQFLKMNFEGTPQSPEHLNMVRSILEKF